MQPICACLVLSLALFGLFLAGSGGAFAQARPDTRNFTCAAAQDFVKQRGQVVMTTGPNTFSRFVADARYCYSHTPLTRAQFAPTKDNPKCAVGRRCVERINPRNN
ncbi:hypothetical protein E1297_28980 [Roseibium sp. RKSG952]|nr:hypothetical protein [Roseibium sp. RKSG952]